MKSKYEISIWEDVLSEDNSFEEQKLIIIGSDTMTSESRAREPELITNINGTNKFSFNMYYNYIDTRTGEEVNNPYTKYLINERKIKVLWKDKWYDFIIKSIKEDQVNHLFTYNCEDAFITELSRNGFNLTFATELENNIGTARELVEKTIEDTDWRFDEEGSDLIYQKIEEPVYEVVVSNSFDALQNPENTQTTIQATYPILLYYSCAPDLVTLQENPNAIIQFYYSGSNEWQQDENDMLVINGHCYSVDVTWEVNGNEATAFINENSIFTLSLATGLSINYRAERYVQSQKTVYNHIVDRYVNVYEITEEDEEGQVETKTLYGYSSTEFNDALAVVNLVTNPSNFSNTSGWIGESLQFKLSPSFGRDTDVAKYSAKSYLHVQQGVYFNTGIQNSRPYIPNGFIIGENYIFRIRAKEDGDEPANNNYVQDPEKFIPSIQGRNINTYEPNGIYYFEIQSAGFKDDWLEYKMTCIKSCPYEMILNSSHPFGIFIEANGNYWFEEVQFYREVFGNLTFERIGQITEEEFNNQDLDNPYYEKVDDNYIQAERYNSDTIYYLSAITDTRERINPNTLSHQSVAQTYWKYFYADQPDNITEKDLEYRYMSTKKWSEAHPVYNNYERYGTIEESNSNRFNILQSIAEAFECWVFLEVKHDEKGYIARGEDGKLQKFVRLKRETGQETGIGFIYGIDLKGVVRNIKSDKISTKTIVEQNENEFGKNGFCSIARSEQNYPRENIIYNFDYYIQHGLLDKNVLYNDLYNTTGMAYYAHLHELNTEYAKNLDDLLNKRSELIKQNATSTIYNQYILSLTEELQSVNEDIMKMASVNDINAGLEYAKNHFKDTKTQSLVNDRSAIKENLRIYQSLNESLQTSLKMLNEYIDNLNTRQNQIIEELNVWNKRFYIKYARFIQEGTWTSEDYWDDDLYYLDAVQVAYTSSRPQISYEINVLRLSDLEDYSSKIFKLGDISFVQDTKYFGYLEDKITPYKEKVILTEITSYFDTPDKDTIKVQNYKTQFDDLFQRITATVQNLEFNEGKYAKAASIVTSDGTIKSSVIQNTFNENKDLVYGAQNESATIDNTGITVTDNTDAAKQVKVTSGGVFVTNDGGTTWKNAIRGDGISADVVTTGKLNTELISIYSADAPSFTWDSYGINAYMLDEGGHVAEYTEDNTVTAATFNDNTYYKKVGNDYIIAEQYEPNVTYYLLTDYDSTYTRVEGVTEDNFIKDYYYIKEDDKYILATEFIEGEIYYIGTRSTKYDKYVRFDKYGIYGVKNKLNYRPISEAQIYNDASFGLTWNKFFMKSKNGNKSIEISTDKDIVVNADGIDRIVIGRVDGALSDNYGIRVKRYNEENHQEEIIFECSNNGSYLSGWTLKKEYLESSASILGEPTIRIQANGNIGCYGHEETMYLENAYRTVAQVNLNVINLKTKTPAIIPTNTTIYVFSNQVGRTASYLREQTTETKEAWDNDYKPNSSSDIQIAVQKTGAENEYDYYELQNSDQLDINWIYTLDSYTYTKVREYERIKEGTTTRETVYVYNYTGTFILTAEYDEQNIFIINGTPDYTINFYVPAADNKWSIDKNGQAIFHDIYADYGRIAGWFIDTEKIYQTTNGRADGPIKQQLSTAGSSINPDDYSFITDAIKAAIAEIGGLTFQNGLIDGYSLAAVYALAQQAAADAWSAQQTAWAVQAAFNGHTHYFGVSGATHNTYVASVPGSHDHAFAISGNTSGPN